MHHVAILKKSRGLLPKIISGEKTIESRWYKVRTAPWDKISAGDIVYFKNSGEPVKVQSEVSKVLQFEKPNKKKLAEIIKKYGGNPGICLDLPFKSMMIWAQDRPYVILIFLKNIQSIKPFNIDKTGYGSACAWLTTKNISRLKI